MAPRYIRTLAAGSPGHDYNREAFLAAAAAHFDVIECGWLDRRKKRPMMLLVKKE